MSDDDRAHLADRLTALVGSRLCHDLVNPLGAIGNGVELLDMTGGAPGPEMDLIRDAVRDAQARIRFFRIAFGAAGGEATISARETRDILSGLHAGSRLSVDWRIETDLPRAMVKLAFLMLSCAETALPMGGEIIVAIEDGDLCLRAQAPRVSVNEALWQALAPQGDPDDLRPAEVQFALLGLTAHLQGRTIHHATGETSLDIWL